ncbi:hypothetical protein V8C86DRAFT_2837062 [Haematococcus lacustris]
MVWDIRRLIPSDAKTNLLGLPRQGRRARRDVFNRAPGTRASSIAGRAAWQQTVGSSALECDQLAALAEEELNFVCAGVTTLGRGLLTRQRVAKQTVISVPIHNALVVSDTPQEAVSVIGDKAQAVWQDKHGALPDDLQLFLQGEERWDTRLMAWVLYLAARHHTLTPASSRGASSSSSSSSSSRGVNGSRGQAGQEEGQQEGLWGRYLAQLPPEEEMSCLLNFTPEEAPLLQLPDLLAEAQRQRDWVLHLHHTWFSRSPSRSPRALQLAHCSQDTLWAAAMVRSRTFSDSLGGEGLTLMVPFADLANHSFEYNGTFRVGADKCSFELSTVRAIAAGQELLISYGQDKSNAELQRDYGFVVPGNPNDRIPLPGCGLLDRDSLSGPPSSPSLMWGGSGGTSQGQGQKPGGPQLMAASLLEGCGMTGDWLSGQLQPLLPITPQAGGVQGREALGCSRRRCALLSLPLFDGYGLYGGAAAPYGGEGKQTTLGIMAGWASKAWTSSGTPDPRKLRPGEVTSEREAVAFWAAHFRSLLAPLGTSVETDRQLLDMPAALRAQHLSDGRVEPGRDGLPASSGRDPGRGVSEQKRAEAGGDPGARLTAAVRCRLEYKLMVEEGLRALSAYSTYLDCSVVVKGSRGR